MFENDNKGEVISGIYCTVSNCVYHDKGDKCHAKSIQVDHQNSTRKDDTCCSTFELRK